MSHVSFLSTSGCMQDACHLNSSIPRPGADPHLQFHFNAQAEKAAEAAKHQQQARELARLRRENRELQAALSADRASSFCVPQLPSQHTQAQVCLVDQRM